MDQLISDFSDSQSISDSQGLSYRPDNLFIPLYDRKDIGSMLPVYKQMIEVFEQKARLYGLLDFGVVFACYRCLDLSVVAEMKRQLARKLHCAEDKYFDTFERKEYCAMVAAVSELTIGIKANKKEIKEALNQYEIDRMLSQSLELRRYKKRLRTQPRVQPCVMKEMSEQFLSEK